MKTAALGSGPDEGLSELHAVLVMTCHKAALIYHAIRQWRSDSFSGWSHTMQLRFEGADAAEHAEIFIEQLPKHTFALIGRQVIDAAIVQTDRFAGNAAIGPVTTVVLQLLTVQE